MVRDPRDKAFLDERRRQMQRLPAILAATDDELAALLKAALDDVRATLAGGTSDFEAFRLQMLERSIVRRLAELGEDMAKAVSARAGEAWAAGVEAVDAPIGAGGIQLDALLADVDIRQLQAMRTFMTGRMRDVSTTVAGQINAQLGLALIGTQTPQDAIGAVAQLVEGGRSRARMIVRTEVGRAYSTAAQARKVQAQPLLPGLRKQWRRSGKIHSRFAHDLADGQIRKPDEPFLINGVALMHPRDPAAPAAETVNCGCVSLPFMASWEMRHPGERPVSQTELERSPTKRRLQEMQTAAYQSTVDGVAKRLAAGTPIKVTGDFHAIGALSETVQTFLRNKGIDPATLEIGITDRQVAHMLRTTKQRRGAALPAAIVRDLPARLKQPKAILFDTRSKDPRLLYVFDVPGGLGTAAVKIRDREKRARAQRHNWLVTGGLVDRKTLIDPGAFETVTGAL